MKKIFLVAILTVVIITGCGTISETEELEETPVVESEEAKIEELNEETEEVEVSKLDLLKQFISGDANSISDVDFEMWNYNGDDLITFKEEESYSIDDIKAIPEKSSWDDISVYYSFFNEKSDNPFLMILVPDNPSYIDENNCLLIFTAKDGEVHLTDFMTSMEEAYTSVYVGKDGIISLKEYPLGMHSGSIISAATYGVNKDGDIELLFSEEITDINAFEYIEADDIEQTFIEVYANSESYPSLGELTLGNDTYYLLYSDGVDTSADAQFINECANLEITIKTREELIPICEEYAKYLGYDINIKELDENTIEWNNF